MIRHVIAGPVWGWFLNRCGFLAIPMPWGSIYYLDFAYYSSYIRKHELVHIAQMRREGIIVWLIRYFYYIARVGYFKNPYEVEARRLSNTNGEDHVYNLVDNILNKYRDQIIPIPTEVEGVILDSYNRICEAKCQK